MSERARRPTRATQIELERDRPVPERAERPEAPVVSPKIGQLAALDWTLARTPSMHRRLASTLPLSRAWRQRILEIVVMRRPDEGTDELLGREGEAFPLAPPLRGWA